MRSDMTVPIARLVANRYARSEPPFRLCYLARAYRAIRPQRGQMREFTQAGVELVGLPAPEGTVEVIEVLAAALDAAGLRRAVIGLGDADLYRQLLAELGDRGRASRRGSSTAWPRTTMSGSRPRSRRSTSARPSARPSSGCPRCAAGRRCSTWLAGSVAKRPSGRLAGSARPMPRCASAGVADRVSVDLGLLRDLGYYTGAILEVYDPALGHILGGGGRYDELMGRFGRPLPAAGFALHMERLHVAQTEEERLAEPEGRSRAAAAVSRATDRATAPTGRR